MKRIYTYPAAIALLVLVSAFGAYRVYQRSMQGKAMSVAAVVDQCKATPSSVLTIWVKGYPVIALTPMPMIRSTGTAAVAYGSLWSAAVVGSREPSAAIRLVADVHRPRKHVELNGPPLDLRWQGHAQLDVHGTISCSGWRGSGPEMVVDRTQRA